MVGYEGLFFDDEYEKLIFSLEGKHLGIVNDKLHCTFKYRPTEDEIFNDIAGEDFELCIVGYGNDGKNSAFKVILPLELQKYYINYDEDGTLKVPHITVSLSEGAKAKDSKDLSFKDLKKPIKIKGRFGYFIKEEDKKFVSYDPYDVKKIK